MRSASVRTRDPIEPSLSLARFGSLLAASFSRVAMASSSRNEVLPRTAFPTIDRAFVTPDSWKRMTRSVDFVIFVVEYSRSLGSRRGGRVPIEATFESLDDVRRAIRSVGGTKVRRREIVGKRARRGEARRYSVLAKQRNAFGKSIASRNIQGSSVAEHNGALLERR